MNIPTDLNYWPPAKVYGSDFRKELCVMAIAVTELELWEWFRTVNPPKNKGYMWWNDDNNYKITRHPLVDSCGHSGATEAVAKRAMQGIAKKGFNQWTTDNFPSWSKSKTGENDHGAGGEVVQNTVVTAPVSTAGLAPPVPPPPSQPLGVKISDTEDKDDMSK